MAGALCINPSYSAMRTTNVYPLQSVLEVQRLMRKLNITPADCLQMLAELLADLDRQIEEHEEKDLPYPLAFLDERP